MVLPVNNAVADKLREMAGALERSWLFTAYGRAADTLEAGKIDR